MFFLGFLDFSVQIRPTQNSDLKNILYTILSVISFPSIIPKLTNHD